MPSKEEFDEMLKWIRIHDRVNGVTEEDLEDPAILIYCITRYAVEHNMRPRRVILAIKKIINNNKDKENYKSQLK